MALVLAILFHAVAIPTLAWMFTFRVEPGESQKTEVAFVRVPAAQWDAARGPAARDPDAPRPDPDRRTEPRKPEDARKEEKKQEKAPGQVVKTSPGNDQVDPNATLAAETSNKVEKQSIARDRSADHTVTMPRETTPSKPVEPPQQAEGEKADSLVLGEPGEKADAPGQSGQRLEIPSLQKKDRLALNEGKGSMSGREASEGIQGNSDRLRVETGTGETDGPSRQGQGGGGAPLRLVPSAAALDKIAGGAFSDHVDGVEEGDGTFLNTREWRYASFFNRIKDNVSRTWNPGKELRRRDPSGEVYAWKDRHTLLTITLREDGEIADVFVERSSGVDFLDQEAIAAFRRAQPFPNPPRGLVDEQGQIKFQFGFYLQVGRGGLRIFR